MVYKKIERIRLFKRFVCDVRGKGHHSENVKLKTSARRRSLLINARMGFRIFRVVIDENSKP